MKYYLLAVISICSLHCQPKPLFPNLPNTTDDNFTIEYQRQVHRHSQFVLTTPFDSMVFQKKGPVVRGKGYMMANGKIIRTVDKAPFHIIYFDNKKRVIIRPKGVATPGFPVNERDTIPCSSFFPFFGASGYYGKMIKLPNDTVLKIGPYIRPCYRYKQYTFDSNFFRKHGFTAETLMNIEYFVDKEWYWPLGIVCQNINQKDFIPDTTIIVATNLKIRKK